MLHDGAPSEMVYDYLLPQFGMIDPRIKTEFDAYDEVFKEEERMIKERESFFENELGGDWFLHKNLSEVEKKWANNALAGDHKERRGKYG